MITLCLLFHRKAPLFLDYTLTHNMKRNRPVIRMLHTNAQVAPIRNVIRVEVTMHICLETLCNAIRVQWDVRENHIIQYTHTINLIEVSEEIACTEDIMIAADKTLLTIQSAENVKVLSSNDDITEMIDLIVRSNDFIPTLNHLLVHFFGARKRPKRRSIGSLKCRAALLMAEVCIADKEMFRHIYLHHGPQKPPA